MDRLVKPGRLVAMMLALVGLIVLYVTQLYKLQIIEGEEYYEKSRNSIVTYEVVPAARGSLLDRYGRELVTNRSCSNIIIDTDELFAQDDPNAIILQLVEILDACGDSYIDELPVTMEPPFEYTEMSDVDKTRLDAYIQDKVTQGEALAEGASSVELMAYFRSRYGIDNSYDARQTRIIAGVRYALNMHYIVKTSDYIFAEDVSIEAVTSLLESNLPGFDVKESFVRKYNTSAAAHIIGYVGLMNEAEMEKYSEMGYSYNAVVGKDGAELAFEEYLHGVDGEAQVTSNSSGTVISRVYTKEPEPGNNVYLTIDIGMQSAAEKILKNYIETTNAEREITNTNIELYGLDEDVRDMITGGAVVVVDVDTGEPLCMANYPTYDISTVMELYSELLEAENAPLFNRALMGAYAPGSTFKPVTAIAGLNEGIVEVNTTVKDEVTFDKYAWAGYAPTCWIIGKGSHGEVNATGAIRVSCNYYFYYVSDFLGIDRMSEYAYNFGLGRSTGIELSESIGNMGTQEYKQETFGEEWRIGDTLQSGIGQGYNLFTPLQIAEYCAALANNGTRHSASVLKSVCSYDYSENVYDRRSEELSRVESAQENYDAVKLGMYQVANDPIGTAYETFWDFRVEVAAKTGTSQLGEDVTNNAVFMCYAPYDDPEIAVAVVVEKGYAGSAVAPIARQVMDYYFSFKESSELLETENTLLK